MISSGKAHSQAAGLVQSMRARPFKHIRVRLFKPLSCENYSGTSADDYDDEKGECRHTYRLRHSVFCLAKEVNDPTRAKNNKLARHVAKFANIGHVVKKWPRLDVVNQKHCHQRSTCERTDPRPCERPSQFRGAAKATTIQLLPWFSDIGGNMNSRLPRKIGPLNISRNNYRGTSLSLGPPRRSDDETMTTETAWG
jgi:hypothetical protein